jgi:hypothetical protein
MTPTQLRRLAERVDKVVPPEGQEYITAIECEIVEPGPNGPVDTGERVRFELSVPLPLPPDRHVVDGKIVRREERPPPPKLPRLSLRR